MNIDEIHVVIWGSGIVVTIHPQPHQEKEQNQCTVSGTYFDHNQLWRRVSGIQIIFLRSILILAKLLL